MYSAYFVNNEAERKPVANLPKFQSRRKLQAYAYALEYYARELMEIYNNPTTLDKLL